MIINKFVFPIKADRTFVSGAIPQGYLTANDINKDMIYVISPAVGETSITARFQNSYQSDEAELVKLIPSSIGIDELVDKDASYYELVKEWNVWQGFIPSKALEYVSYNRAGLIGVSFSLLQNIIPNTPSIIGINYIDDITRENFVPAFDGYYIVKLATYEYNGVTYHLNDMLIKHGDEILKRSSITQGGNTSTIEYSVDPSVFGGNFESIDPNIVDIILQQIGKNTQDIKLINLRFNNYYTKLETYNREQIDDKFEDVGIITDNHELRIQDLESDKVDKTTTIIGLDLQDNILIGEFRTALGNATQSVAGLLSAEDKTHLDGLVALLETSDGNNVVDTIGEILAIFQNYPEGADLVTVLQGKVDKVTGMGLSKNDFTDEYKNKVDDVIDDVSQLKTGKQDKLTAGDNITINPVTNVISASGSGGGGAVDSVNGKTGTVVINKSDVGLSNVNNTSDANKPISTATQTALIDINNNIGNKVDKVSGKALSANDYTNVDKAAVAEIPTLKTDVGNKVDKVAGKGLSTNDYSTAEKNKLAGLESSKFLGQFTNSSLLPTGSLGSYAYVDAGIGSDVQKFIWDTTDNKWVQAGVVTQDITPAQVKSLYESNADTNAFTDNEQSKLAGIQVGAEKNQTPLTNIQIKTLYETNTNTNAYTNAEKNKLSGLQNTEIAINAEVVAGTNTTKAVNPKTLKDNYWTKLEQTGYESEIETSKQNKLVAGDNITIDENTNVISASGGGGGGTVDWEDVENKPELYNKSEIDLMLGDIGSALDAILGV